MEERPLKKSEVLAIENIKRIADQIRSERNDALALAQELREKLESAVTGLTALKAMIGTSAPGTVVEQIDTLVERLKVR
jgi:hypothetical protein